MPEIKGYSLKEVADKVGVSSATIVCWIETNKVRLAKKKKAQGQYIFTESDLQKMIVYKNRILAGEPTTDAPPQSLNKNYKGLA